MQHSTALIYWLQIQHRSQQPNRRFSHPKAHNLGARSLPRIARLPLAPAPASRDQLTLERTDSSGGIPLTPHNPNSTQHPPPGTWRITANYVNRLPH